MPTEFAGAIDVDPPLTTSEIACIRRLAGDADTALMGWTPARDGGSLRPRSRAHVAGCLESMGYLLATIDRPGRLAGMVVAFETGTRELVAITVSRGRVTRRTLRRPSSPNAPRPRSNVVDLSARRRSLSHALTPR